MGLTWCSRSLCGCFQSSDPHGPLCNASLPPAEQRASCRAELFLLGMGPLPVTLDPAACVVLSLPWAHTAQASFSCPPMCLQTRKPFLCHPDGSLFVQSFLTSLAVIVSSVLYPCSSSHQVFVESLQGASTVLTLQKVRGNQAVSPLLSLTF